MLLLFWLLLILLEAALFALGCCWSLRASQPERESFVIRSGDALLSGLAVALLPFWFLIFLVLAAWEMCFLMLLYLYHGASLRELFDILTEALDGYWPVDSAPPASDRDRYNSSWR